MTALADFWLPLHSGSPLLRPETGAAAEREDPAFFTYRTRRCQDADMWWNQDAWKQMPVGRGGVLDGLWEDFYARFEFRPGMNNSPAIKEPTPSVTFDLSAIFAADTPDFSAGEDRLNAEVLSALKEAFGSQTVAVLDWQHPGYWFQPASFDPTEPEDWAITPFPNGDYYIFAAEDLMSGTFGHPWEQTLCVWGEPLLGELQTRLEAWLPVRRSQG